MNHMQAETLLESREFLEDIRDAVHETSRGDLYAPTTVLLQLLDLLQSAQEADSPATNPKELAEFIDHAMAALRSSLADGSAPSQEVERLTELAADRWGRYLADVDEATFDARFDDGWNRVNDSENNRLTDEAKRDGGGGSASGAELAAPSEQVIQDLLAQLTGLAASTTPVQSVDSADDSFVPPEVFDIPDELREAFLDDAGRCVSSIEEALLVFEANPKNREPLQQICRELHTLKGASGSVGLMSLANYLHEFEDSLRDSNAAKCALPSIESLFETVDSIRQQIDAVAPLDAGDAEQPQQCDLSGDGTPRTPAPSPLAKFADAGGDEESVRVKSSQLNRLMDMLAELVMLRNRRDSELSELKEVHSELIHSVSRLRSLGDGVGMGAESGSVPANPLPRLTEVANDVLESAQRLRDCYQPVAEGNLAVSQFIRQFRQELVELRRVPVSGLFRRLQRVASDAARAERKQVHLRLVGEDAGIERSLQERLYEPLLHIIRNAVSHGIEDGEERTRKGKEPVGVVTLEAQTGADLLVLEIRDDGRGLNYDALRRRGTELGLLTPDKAATREELALLIFHPGFSTQANASQISGRGVGMDVVASAIARMRGWVEVDSTPGKGTTVRLTFPLPSVIQHTMVFRSCGQLFALPMQFIQGAGGVDDSHGTDDSSRAIQFGKMIGSGDADCDAATQMLILSSETPTSTGPATSKASDANPRRLALLVDEIVGPEEVVVRPLPSLLKHHPLCSGATLSGMGEVVLVLDKHRVTELALRQAFESKPDCTSRRRAATRTVSADPQRPSVLVVDDSVSARRRLVRSLGRYGVDVTEASDGAEAAELLKTGSYAAVFSDLEMPHQNGFELLTEIRAVHDANSLPVLIISSRAEDELRARATELGAQAYLVKPLADDALDSAIATIPTISALLVRETRKVQ